MKGEFYLWGSFVLLTIALSAWVFPAIANSASEFRQRGLALRAQGNYGGAIGAFEQAIQLEPQNLDNQLLLGWTVYKAGDRDRAAQVLSQVTAKNPFAVNAWNALGIVDLVSGNVHSSVGSHLWATMLNPKNEVAHYNLSLALTRLQVFDRAIAHGEVATRLEPDNPHTWLALAIAQAATDSNQAKQHYRKAMALNPGLENPDIRAIDLQEAGFSPEQIQQVQALTQR